MCQGEEAFRTKMRLVLNEWVAATIQLYFGKATPENDDNFHAFLREIVPLEVIFGKEALKMDPLEKLHPLEVTGGKNGRGFPGGAIDHPFVAELIDIEFYTNRTDNCWVFSFRTVLVIVLYFVSCNAISLSS